MQLRGQRQSFIFQRIKILPFKIMKKLINLSRTEMLFLVMYDMTKIDKNLKFEDIVVEAFKKFPEDFHLRGYEEYPDSGDLVHKPLYSLRKKGYLEANNKVFSLTDRGLNFAMQISAAAEGEIIKSSARFSRFVEKEINRIKSTEGFKLFISGEKGEINDTDFYSYFGITPRTSKNNFHGRFNTITEVIEELSRKKDATEENNKIISYYKFLVDEKFKHIVEYFNKI